MCGGMGWKKVMGNAVLLFERFVSCFPYKRMRKSCDLIVLEGI